MRTVLFSLVFLRVWVGIAQAEPRVSGQPSCRLHYSQLIGANSEEQALMAEANGSFYKVKPRSPAETDSANRAAFSEMDHLPFPVASKRKAFLDSKGRNQLFDDVMALPEVQESACGRYNGSGMFGFCFGRAFATHLQALKSGLDKRSIRKVWMVGDLRTGSDKWKFHVATAVRGEDGKWFVMDTNYGKPLPLEKWYARLRGESDPGQTARFYSTAAGRFLPNSWDNYKSTQLARPIFRDFFRDLMDSVRADGLRK